jgi:exopolysaccharide biosynthesis WecB/TagA/CpsF family protein
MYLYLKKIIKKEPERIDGTTLNTNILNEIIKRKIPVGIIGGKFSYSFIKEEFEKRKIDLAGYRDGYFNKGDRDKIINEVSRFPCDILFVGMGVPKQEFFAYELSRTSSDKVIICVGNFFEFYFGTVKRAPQLIRNMGIEWLYRLAVEPERLWKRYLLGIPEFVYRGIKYRRMLHSKS